MSSEFTLYQPPQAPAASQTVMAQAKQQLGLVPNLMKVMAGNPAVLQAYQDLNRHFSASGLNDIEQHVVVQTVNALNECHYCTAAHSALGERQALPEGLDQQLRRQQPLDEPKLEALRQFTTAVVNERGWVSEASVADFLAAGYQPQQVFAVVLGVTMKTLSNYVNHLADTPVDEAFVDYQDRG